MEYAYNKGVEEWLQKHPDLQHEATFAGIARVVGCSFSTARDLWDGTAVLYEHKPLSFSVLVERVRSFLLHAPGQFEKDRRLRAFASEADVYLADEKYRRPVPPSVEHTVWHLESTLQEENIRKEAEREAARWCSRGSKEHAERVEALMPFVRVRFARQVKYHDWLTNQLHEYMPEPPQENRWHLYACHGKLLLGPDDAAVRAAEELAKKVDTHNLRGYAKCVRLRERLHRLLQTADEILANPPRIPLRQPNESRYLRNPKSIVPARVFPGAYSTDSYHGDTALLVFQPAPPELARWILQGDPPSSHAVENLRKKVKDPINMELVAVEELLGMPMALLLDEGGELVVLNLFHVAWVMRLCGRDVTFARSGSSQIVVGAFKGQDLVAVMAPIQVSEHTFPSKKELLSAVTVKT